MGVEVTHQGCVAVVTLDWPEQRNALGPTEAEEVTAALSSAALPREVSAVVLTGRGAFCAGGNLPAIVELASQGPGAVRATIYGTFQSLIKTLLAVSVPTIAAIDGPAVGLGFDLALACDQRVVGRLGWCRQGWAGIGLIPGTGGELLLRRLAPGLLWDMLAGDRTLRADDLAAWQLASSVDGTALEESVARGQRLGRLPRATLEGYVALFRHELRDQLDAHLAQCLDLQVELICSDEFAERAASVLARTNEEGRRA